MGSGNIQIFKKNIFKIKNWLDLNKNSKFIVIQAVNRTGKNYKHGSETILVKWV